MCTNLPNPFLPPLRRLQVCVLPSQRNCLYFALTSKPVRRFIPKVGIQKQLHGFVSHTLFKITIFIAVVCNVIILSIQVSSTLICSYCPTHVCLSSFSSLILYYIYMQFYRQSEKQTQAIYWINVLFTVFFGVEIVLKIFAFTPTVRLFWCL